MIPDATMGGYFAKHGRPPAFEGSDGLSYSADYYLGEDDDHPGVHVGSIIFVRWAGDGGQPVGHLETGDLVRGRSRAEAKRGLEAMTLHAVKEQLERAIARHRELPEW